MSNTYAHGDTVPNEVLSSRLLELAQAVVNKDRVEFQREFTVRMPAVQDWFAQKVKP